MNNGRCGAIYVNGRSNAVEAHISSSFHELALAHLGGEPKSHFSFMGMASSPLVEKTMTMTN